MLSKCVENKIEFVKKINDILPTYVPNIERVEYVIFENKENERWYLEFLVITYKGGAETVRSCTGNSCGAIFEEISSYLFSGYYEELIDFQNLMADPDHWTMYR